MTWTTDRLLEQSEALSDPERSEILVQLARRIAAAPHDTLTDDDLIATADRVLDERVL